MNRTESTAWVSENPRVGGSIDENRPEAILTLRAASLRSPSNPLRGLVTRIALRAPASSWFASQTVPPLATIPGKRRWISDCEDSLS